MLVYIGILLLDRMHNKYSVDNQGIYILVWLLWLYLFVLHIVHMSINILNILLSLCTLVHEMIRFTRFALNIKTFSQICV